MKQDLHAENQKLRLQLKVLLSQARKNEDKMRRFNEQEFRLISTSSLAELVKLVIYNYRATFELDAVSLVLLDPEKKMAAILEGAGLVLEEMPEVVLLSGSEELDALYGMSLQPVLDGFRDPRHGFMFPTARGSLQSVALLPLERGGELIGSLNLGSFHGNRFVHGTSTDFLQRLSAIVSICLENAANLERLKSIGLTDPLTCIKNRRYFEQRLLEEVADAMRHQQTLSCMFLDVDHFKRINDELGHQTGDLVLREIARLVNSQLRSSDVFARYGGEEFVVLLPNTTDRQAGEIAERIRCAVAEYLFPMPPANSWQVTISIGMSVLPLCEEVRSFDDQAKEFVAVADQALYEAKRLGRNRVVHAKQAVRRLASSLG